MPDARSLLLRVMVERMVKLLHAYMPALPPLPPSVTSGRLEMLKLELDDPDYIESRRLARDSKKSQMELEWMVRFEAMMEDGLDYEAAEERRRKRFAALFPQAASVPLVELDQE